MKVIGATTDGEREEEKKKKRTRNGKTQNVSATTTEDEEKKILHGEISSRQSALAAATIRLSTFAIDARSLSQHNTPTFGRRDRDFTHRIAKFRHEQRGRKKMQEKIATR